MISWKFHSKQPIQSRDIYGKTVKKRISRKTHDGVWCGGFILIKIQQFGFPIQKLEQNQCMESTYIEYKKTFPMTILLFNKFPMWNIKRVRLISQQFKISSKCFSVCILSTTIKYYVKSRSFCYSAVGPEVAYYKLFLLIGKLNVCDITCNISFWIFRFSWILMRRKSSTVSARNFWNIYICIRRFRLDTAKSFQIHWREHVYP